MAEAINRQTGATYGPEPGVVCIGSRPGPTSTLAMPEILLVPTTPQSDQETAMENTLAGLLQSIDPSTYTTIPAAPVAISINTPNSTSMSVFSQPSTTSMDQSQQLILVPLKLIPLLSKKITDRHLRETYRYYKWFVNKETRAAISEWPEGESEKQRWKARMQDVGRDVRFLGRRQYQSAVEETIKAKGLTMACGQTPTSWHDCLRALFNPDHYTEERRELVYWIQFALLKESNNSWLHRQETEWCASVYGIKIMYDKGWEGNVGHRTIDQADHGESFLPFRRARGSWFKWFFIKGANEIREVIQAYSFSTHGIYERICVTDNKNAQRQMKYTKRKFVHGDGYIAEPLDQHRKKVIRSTNTPAFTMESVTAWLELQGKSVNDKPAALYLSTNVNCEMSSMTRSISDHRSTGVLNQDQNQFQVGGIPMEHRTLTTGKNGNLRSSVASKLLDTRNVNENMEMVSCYIVGIVYESVIQFGLTHVKGVISRS
jgi:hypothetical protein